MGKQQRLKHRGEPVVSFAGWVSRPPMGYPLTALLIASANRLDQDGTMIPGTHRRFIVFVLARVSGY